MYSGSIFTGAVILAFMIPSLVSAGEVTPQRSRPQPPPNRIIGTTGWLGFAASPNQRVFKSDPQQGEINARNIAKNECETTTLRTCNVIAVPETSDVSVVGCDYNGKSGAFVGGSHKNLQTQIALDKASEDGFPKSSCVEFYTY
jgi:hypothetical protein